MVALCQTAATSTEKRGVGEVGYLSLGVVLRHRTEKKQSTTDS